MAKIAKILAREILDSRGHPTIETTIYLDTGHSGTASVPSGASSARHEAVESRDNDPRRFQGLGVIKAIDLINRTLSAKLKGIDPARQTELDQFLINEDGTADKSNFGANTLLSISQAAVVASAAYYQLPVYQYLRQKYYQQVPLNRLPGPTFNIINGGA
ncbi:phosphopyruvate hydratase, partial [Candidatus Beckwithbacteria bacterium CG23_combo_of_CG06-09_8_20_14_all_47_9]